MRVVTCRRRLSLKALASVPLVLLAALAAAVGPALAEGPAPPPPPTKDDFKAEVTVRIAEIQMLVTDKHGKPVLDLKPGDIEVSEDGEKRKVAFLEPFATRDLTIRMLPKASPLVTADGDATVEEESPAITVGAPQPLRWIVLLFDIFNSRAQDRERWAKAAQSWVEKEMRANDRVGIAVLERAGIRTIQNLTADKATLAQVLSSTSFMSSGEHHDYNSDMSSLLDSLQTCVNAYDYMRCCQLASTPVVADWEGRTRLTITALRKFVSSLAAVPGRKAVMFVSNGILIDPGSMAVNAVLATIGTDKLSYSTARTLFQASQMQGEFLEFTRIAAAADVTFFTFDTRSSALRTSATDADQRVQLNERQFTDPFAALFDESRGALDSTAIRTGGRSLNGPVIEKSLPSAALAFDGLYTLGYHRDPSATGRPKIKVKVARKGVDVTFPDRYDPLRESPVVAHLELGIGKVRPHEQKILVPVIIQVPLDELSFVRSEKEWLAELSVFVEAVAPDGRREVDAFEALSVTASDEQFDNRVTRRFAHQVELVVAPGPYRIRVRTADATFRRAAERAIDLTVFPDYSVRPGIQKFD